ncbi:hypothetical protein [uncultured Hyphomonas sp.]|uniref:hypothetical protein n=1 Tax=uncultured Hyphomonas sp. TaxID=225298 RepID=UPI002AAAAA59|nr:hypothetical protein [uncultured Hyphomonas sp.]
MLQDIFISLMTLGLLVGLMLPRVRKATAWRATVTPLASIIGSGFLVLGPILSHSYGKYAPLVMLFLCLAAYAFGAAIRFNIANLAQKPNRTAPERRTEYFASWALSFAYCISVAYYLNLFGAFAVKMTTFNSPAMGKAVTSAVLLLILAVGWLRGFSAMEKMEQVSVSLKLAIIAGLLAGLSVYFFTQAEQSELTFAAPAETGWTGIALAFGLIITVQGFETSRYLGSEYKPDMRICSMRYSQWLATAIYMAYVVLLTYAFDAGTVPLTETAIVDMMKVVSAILPAMLIVAALSAQFSAAIADTSGAGGLVEELSGGRVSPRLAYLILVLIGLGLTWFSHVFQIISFASKAFAYYYALQCGIAAVGAFREAKAPIRGMAFAAFGLLALAVLFFGQPVEGAG